MERPVELSVQIPIRFADVDAAGIVYYPRFFHYYHSAFEEFFGLTHGTPYPEWIEKRRVGFPTRHLEADFQAPLRYGQDLSIAIHLPRIGERSVDFHFEARTPETAAWARITKVCVDMDTLKPCPLPDDLRPVLEQYGGVE